MNEDRKLFHPTPRLLLFAIIAVLIWLIVYYWMFGEHGSSFYTSFMWGESSPPREVSLSSEQFQEIWRKDSVFAGASDDKESIFLASQNNDLYALVSFDSTQRESLYRLNMLTGELIWQIPPQDIDARLGVTTLLRNSHHLYVGIQGGKAMGDSLIDAGRVDAYALDATGEFSWSRRIGGARGFVPFNVSDSLIHVAGDSSTHFYVLDAMSGEVVFKDRKISEDGIGNGIPLLVERSISYEQHGCNFIRAVDLALDELIWETQLDGCVFQPVVVRQDEILVLQETRPRQLVAIDKESGNIAWGYDKSGIISNIALGDNSILYFLTSEFSSSEAVLRVVDADSGELLDSAVFSGGADKNQMDYKTYPFSVTSSANMVVIYFGDSAQLFAFTYSDE